MSAWIVAVCAIVCGLSTMALAASPFDGIWRLDLENAQLPTKPVVLVIKDGIYACSSCVPAVTVKADGADHAVGGSDFFDTLAVTLTGPRSMRLLERKGGKVISDITRALSKDGNTIALNETSTSTSNVVTTSQQSFVRVAPAPLGADPMSGGWRLVHLSNSDSARLMNYRITDNVLSFSLPNGEAFSATIDGPDAPFAGNPGVDTVSIKRLDANTLEETDKKRGQSVFVARTSVAPGSNVMVLNYTNVLSGRTEQIKAYRQ